MKSVDALHCWALDNVQQYGRESTHAYHMAGCIGWCFVLETKLFQKA